MESKEMTIAVYSFLKEQARVWGPGLLLLLLLYATYLSARTLKESVLRKNDPSTAKNVKLEVESRHRFALLIGVNDYDSLDNLKYCEADMISLRSALVDGGYPSENIYMLLGALATRENVDEIVSQIQTRLANLSPEKTEAAFLFAFSGHGCNEFLCLRDTNASNIGKTAFSLEKFLGRLAKPEFSHVNSFFFLDACRKTEGLKLHLDRVEKIVSSKTVIFSACQKDQVANERKELGHGIFFHYVIEGLRPYTDAKKRQESSNSVGIHVSSLFEFVTKGVPTHLWVLDQGVKDAAARETAEDEKKQDANQQDPTILTERSQIPFVVQFASTLDMESLPEHQQKIIVDLIQLPAINEGWWGDEMPWYLPCFRYRLANHYSKTATGMDWEMLRKEYMYCSSQVVQETLVQKLRACLVDQDEIGLLELMCNFTKAPDLEKLETALEIVNGGKKKAAQADLNSPAHPKRVEIWNHTEAVLKHLYYIQFKRGGHTSSLSEDGEPVYKGFYSKTQTDIGTEAFSLLAQSDAARFCVLKKKDKEDELSEFEALAKSICRFDDTSLRAKKERAAISSLFIVELLTTFAKEQSDRGIPSEPYFTLAAAIANSRFPDHPLHASVLERRGWSYVDSWRLEDAEKEFAKARKIREAVQTRFKEDQEKRKMEDLKEDPLTELFINYAMHADATIQYYKANSPLQESVESFFQIGEDAIKLFKPDSCTGFSCFRLKTRVDSRVATSYMRGADAILFASLRPDANINNGLKLECIDGYKRAIERVENDPGQKSLYDFIEGKKALAAALFDRADPSKPPKNATHPKGENATHPKGERAEEAAIAVYQYLNSRSLEPVSNFLDVLLKNPRDFGLFHRDNMELNLFMGEFLLRKSEGDGLLGDIMYMNFLMSQFTNKPDIASFIQPYCKLAKEKLQGESGPVGEKMNLFFENLCNPRP